MYPTVFTPEGRKEERRNISSQMHILLRLAAILCLVAEGTPISGRREGEVQVVSVDQGSNFTLPCGSFNMDDSIPVMWIHEDKKDIIVSYHTLRNGSIFFTNIRKSDDGVYSCRIESDYKSSWPEEDSFEARVRVRVRTPPMAPRNVTLTPYSLSAVVFWEMEEGGDGGYPIRNFQIAYRLKNETDKDWKTCLPAFIEPNLRQYSLYHLQPSSTYLVKVWANNKLGSGGSTVVEIVTHNDPQEIELQKHFLEGLDSFDVRIWIVAVVIVVTTLFVLGIATCCLFYREYNMHLASDTRDLDGESIELMPNIILNPGYDFHSMEISHRDENSNNTNTTSAALRIISTNSVIHPSHV